MNLEASKPREYYNNIYMTNSEYDKPFNESVYFNIWKEVLKYIPNTSRVIELGCGTGQFSEMLRGRGVADYMGVDFSDVAINKAIAKSDALYKCNDFFTTEILNNPDHNMYSYFDTIVALETLEHLDDIKLLKMLRNGARIVFSVPDFGDPSHVVFFDDVDSVRERYKDYIEIEKIEKVWKYFICVGVIK